MNKENIQNLLYSIGSELKRVQKKHLIVKQVFEQRFVGISGPKNEPLQYLSANLIGYADSLKYDLELLQEAQSLLIKIKFKFRVMNLFRNQNNVWVPNLQHFNRLLNQMIDGTEKESRETFKFLSKMHYLEQDSDSSLLFLTLWQEPIKKIGDSIKGLKRIISLIHEIELLSKEQDYELPKQDWKFIQDDELRSIISRDYIELGYLLKVKAQKSSLVMCGSILEAVLVAVLSKNEELAQTEFKKSFSKSTNTKLERWNLFQLITVAEKIKLLDDDTRRHADIVRDYRNLIHPSSEIRRKTKIDDELIAAEVALLKRILRTLSEIE